MSLVSNTGPLVALAKVDVLPLLKSLFDAVEIPPAVHRELLAKGGMEAQRLDDAFGLYIRVTVAPPAWARESSRPSRWPTPPTRCC